MPRIIFFVSRPSMRPRAAAEGDILRRQVGALSWPIWSFLQIGLTAETEAAVMHLRSYRDESCSGHLDLVGEGDHPSTINLVAAMVAAILVVGFAIAPAAQLIR
jgi:hypothetical protein